MKIKDLRISKGMTQEEVGNKVGVQRTTVAMWESGAAMPRADKLPILAKIFGCEISELFK